MKKFLLSSGNLSRLHCVYQPLCQSTKLKGLWRWLLSDRSRVIWRDFWGIWRMHSSSKNERNILHGEKTNQRKATPLMKNRNHYLAQLFLWVFLVNTLFLWHFLWVFLVNTHTTTIEPKRTEQLTWNTWAHEQCPIVTEKECQLPSYFQKFWLAQSLPQICEN